MARRKHHKKATHRRKRSMSGVGGSQLTSVLVMAAGAIAGRVVQNKFSSTVNPKLLAGGQVALGLMLPKFVKNKMVASFGTGMAINGVVTVAASFGVISAVSGMAGTTDYQLDYVGEDGDDMGAPGDLSAIAGEDDSDYMGVLDEGTMSGDNLAILAGYDDAENY